MLKNLKIIFFVFAVSTVNAQTYTWKGTSSTSWTNGSNWTVSNPLTSNSTDQVYPTPCGNVVIPTVSSGSYPSLTAGVTIRSLTFMGDGRLSFGTSGNITYRAPVASTFANVALTSNPNIFGLTYVIHADDTKLYAVQRSSNQCSPIYRFQVKPGDNWDSDYPGNYNTIGSTRRVKERSELKADNASEAAYGRDIWISYSMYVETGDDIIYLNADDEDNPDWICITGQWHQNSDAGSVPFDISLRGQGTLNFRARNGADNVTDPIGSTTITREAWHHILIKMNFAKKWSGGTKITVWVDGAKNPVPVVNETNLTHGFAYTDSSESTVKDTLPGYWKFGVYRTASDLDFRIRYANVEIKTDGSSLASRQTNPLPVHD